MSLPDLVQSTANANQQNPVSPTSSSHGKFDIRVIVPSLANCLATDGPTDEPTDGRTDKPTDALTDGWTDQPSGRTNRLIDGRRDRPTDASRYEDVKDAIVEKT